MNTERKNIMPDSLFDPQKQGIELPSEGDMKDACPHCRTTGEVTLDTDTLDYICTNCGTFRYKG